MLKHLTSFTSYFSRCQEIWVALDWGLSSSQNMPNLCKGFQSLYKFSFPKPSCIRLDIVINPKKNVFSRAHVEDEIIAMANKKASIQIQILIPFKVQVLLHFHSFSFQVRVLNRNFFKSLYLLFAYKPRKKCTIHLSTCMDFWHWWYTILFFFILQSILNNN